MTGLAIACILIIGVVVLGGALYQHAIAPLYPRARYASATLTVWAIFVAWLSLYDAGFACLSVGLLVPIFGDAFFRVWMIRLYGLSLYQERISEFFRRGGAWSYIRQLVLRQAIHSSVPCLVLALSGENRPLRMLAIGLLAGLATSLVSTTRLALRDAHPASPQSKTP